MVCRDVMDRLSPFLDDELDPVASREVSRHLESCADCAAAFDRRRRLSESLRRDLEYHRASDLLRARVVRDARAAVGEGARSRRAATSWRWLSVAAAVVAVVGGTWWVTTPDQHTVKPWFAGKLDFSPPVTDFAAAGYPLVGGRLDYLQGHPVAALVYLHHQHVINVFVWPAATALERFTRATTRQGFHVIHATHAGMAYWVVSDLNAEELASFARMFAAPPAKPS